MIMAAPRTQQLKNGTLIYLHHQQEFISDIIFASKEYFEKRTLDIINRHFNCSHVLDVGANIGNHSHFFVKECNSVVYAFEPIAKKFELLMLNVGSQHLFRIALSDKIGTTRLYTYNDSLGNNTIADLWDEPPRWGNGLGAEIAPQLPLDVFSFPCVTFVKIDVEGAELRVLKGARNTLLRHRPQICVEYGTDEGLASKKFEYRSKDIEEFLGELGYKNLGNDNGGNNFYVPITPITYF